MDAAQRLIQTWVASPRDEEIEKTISSIASGEIKLLHVVQGLGEYLTSEDDDLRNKGVEFLAKVVSKSPPEQFSRQSVKVLLAFFLSKLEDTDTIIPALKGLLGLSPLPTLVDDDARQIVDGLFTHVKMSALVQAQRFVVFSILDSLIARHREGLKSMGKEFLSGYVILADGEKDPRNLVVAFAIARVILVEFEIKDHVEDLFNVTACYFPISFRPPPGDPYGVSADDLKRALRSCLSATPAFGPPAIPLFLEKIASVAPPAKRDTLATLDECLPVYGPGIARTHARKLWNALKLEIFQPTDALTEVAALSTVQVLIRTIYSEGEDQPSTDIEGLAKDACEECIQILKEPEKSQATPAMKVLCAFVSTTPSVSRYTIMHAVPHLVKLFLNPDEAPNRGPTLRLLSSLIAAIRDSSAKASETGDSPLAPYKDEVLGILITGTKLPSSALPAIEGLRALVTSQGLLEDEEVGFVVQNVNELLSNEQEIAGVSESALELLTTISASTPTHVSQTTLPLLFSLLPDQAPPRADSVARDNYWNVLNSLSRLCVQPVLFETLVIRLSTKLDLLCGPLSPQTSVKAVDAETTAAYAHAILTTLANVLSEKVGKGDVDVPKYIDRLVIGLLALFLYSAVAPSEEYLSPVVDTRLIAVAAKIINLVSQTLTSQKHEAFAAQLTSVYLKGDLQAISGSAKHAFQPEDSFAPFEPGATDVQRNMVPLFAAELSALDKDVSLPIPDQSSFLEMLVGWSIEHATSTLQRESARHIVASFVNKRTKDLDPFLTRTLGSFWNDLVGNTSASVDKRRLAISEWTWICKGLVVQNHPSVQAFVERLFELFDDEGVSWDAARAIGLIIAPNKILTKSNHAVLKILHAQKYANSVLPRLIQGAQNAAELRKQTASLVGLTSLIRSIPKTTYAHEMPTLVPLLLRGLDLPDTEIRANVIETLLSAAEADVAADVRSTKEGSIVAEHALSLATIMLKNSLVSIMPDVKVRVAALRYLEILPKIVRYDTLHPHKATVLREMSKILDDPKRVVRKVAVDARTSWFTFSG